MGSVGRAVAFYTMSPYAIYLVILLAGAATSSQIDLVRLLNDRPWLIPQSRVAMVARRLDLEPRSFDSNEEQPDAEEAPDDNSMERVDNLIRVEGGKRSAVATALNGRRRRQPAPAPALGKAVTPYVGVGVLNDVGSFFGNLRDNLEALASLSPQQRETLLHEPPTVVHANNAGSGGGVRRLHALRPLRPTGNIRSYNRRSFVEADDVYPGANNHDPALLWTGLGR